MEENEFKKETQKHRIIFLMVFLKHLGLCLFGSVISAGFMYIVQQYDIEFKNDSPSVILMAISWSTYCTCQGYLEYNRVKKGK